jgi:hypothetical protein
MIISFSSAVAAAAEQDGGPFPSTDPTQPRLFFSIWPAQQQQQCPHSAAASQGEVVVYAARE